MPSNQQPPEPSFAEVLEMARERAVHRPEDTDPYMGLILARYDELAERALSAEAALREFAAEVVEEIEYWPGTAQYLTEDERSHPRGNGWARVHDRATAILAAIEEPTQ